MPQNQIPTVPGNVLCHFPKHVCQRGQERKVEMNPFSSELVDAENIPGQPCVLSRCSWWCSWSCNPNERVSMKHRATSNSTMGFSSQYLAKQIIILNRNSVRKATALCPQNLLYFPKKTQLWG